jgi:hypothetical protein
MLCCRRGQTVASMILENTSNTSKYFFLHISLSTSSLLISNPSYLRQLLLHQPPRSTCFSSHFTLLYPLVASLKFSYRSIRQAAPRLWNQLPPDHRPSSLHFSFPHLPYMPVIAHPALTLASFYLNSKPIFSINPFHLSSYLSLDCLFGFQP